MQQNANLDNFLKSRMKVDKKIKDEKKNKLLLKEDEIKLLPASDKDSLRLSLEALENIEPDTIQDPNITYAKTDIGRFCFRDNIVEFDIIKNESILNENLEKMGSSLVSDVDTLINLLHELFLSENIVFNQGSDNFLRLRNPKARQFYAMILSWRIEGRPYKYMINSFLIHWENTVDKIIFVGKRWGEIKRDVSDRLPQYVDIVQKNRKQRVNLAILRIKEEQDFIDTVLIKFIDVLDDLKIINKPFYDKIRYGSDNPTVICLLKNGLSIDLAKCILGQKYRHYFDINVENNEFTVLPGIFPKITDKMKQNSENNILIFEMELFSKLH